ncbi:MAG: nucleoside hydrolase [Xanthomonadales bacterium]|nr:nucleoside hydrolase [Xanthomonadales bacterium]
MSSIPLLIDTDPGVDDALAILMALRHAQHRVVALTIAAGNVGLEHTVRNARSLVDIAGSATPIFPGCPAPLLHAAEDAAFVHGQDGFGDVALPEPSTRVESEHAALAMLRLSHEHAGALTMVMLGPLTNLALALKLDPTLPGRVPRLLIMGGAVNLRGNTSVAAEFNVAFDPEAARIVFENWPQFDLLDWEATLAHPLEFDDMAAWCAAGGTVGDFYARISEKTRHWVRSQPFGRHWHSADGLAMAAALEPDAIEAAETHAVVVETEGRACRGATVVDWKDRSGARRQARIVQRYSQSRYTALVAMALGAG